MATEDRIITPTTTTNTTMAASFTPASQVARSIREATTKSRELKALKEQQAQWERIRDSMIRHQIEFGRRLREALQASIQQMVGEEDDKGNIIVPPSDNIRFHVSLHRDGGIDAATNPSSIFYDSYLSFIGTEATAVAPPRPECLIEWSTIMEDLRVKGYGMTYSDGGFNVFILGGVDGLDETSEADLTVQPTIHQVAVAPAPASRRVKTATADASSTSGWHAAFQVIGGVLFLAFTVAVFVASDISVADVLFGVRTKRSVY